MTLLHFDLRKPVRRTGFRTHFLTKFKKFQNKQQNLHRKLQMVKFDDNSAIYEPISTI